MGNPQNWDLDEELKPYVDSNRLADLKGVDE